MRRGAALLGLALPCLAYGLVEQPMHHGDGQWHMRLREVASHKKSQQKVKSPGETYGSWANAWAHGTRLPAGKVVSADTTAKQNSSGTPAKQNSSGRPGMLLGKGNLAGQIQSCFKEDCLQWMDNKGERIEAHGAGLLQDPVSGRWYWYGESQKTEDISTHGVNCYSADNLAGPWRREGTALVIDSWRPPSPPQVIRQGMITVPGKTGPYVVERPKVIYNKATKKYVMWFHLDDARYQFRHVGVATSDSAAGPFEFVHAIQPDGIPSLDMSLWVDVDDKAYFIRSCNNNYTGISRLTDDYLNTKGILSTGPRLEGMALFRLPNGTLYMMTSHLTGWKPNPLMLYRADGPDLSDPRWVDLGNPTHDPTSFNTQPTYVVPYTTKKKETYFIYMADNWIHGGPSGLIEASYVWLPIHFESDNVFIDKLDSWHLEDPWARKIERPVFG